MVEELSTGQCIHMYNNSEIARRKQLHKIVGLIQISVSKRNMYLLNTSVYFQYDQRGLSLYTDKYVHANWMAQGSLRLEGYRGELDFG